MQDYYEALSEGYSKLSLSRALRRYISLPIVSDQSAQLVLGLGGDIRIQIGLLGVLKVEYIKPVITVGKLSLAWFCNHSLFPYLIT